MKSGALALLLALVLLCHWVGLTWLSDQAQQGKPMVLLPDPLFTRMILPVPPRQTPPVAPAAKVAPDVNTAPDLAEAAPAIDVAPTGSEPEAAPAPTETAAASSPQPAPVPAPPDPPPQASAPLDSWPADTRVSYRLGGYYQGDLYGSARVQWQRVQSRYQVRLDMSLALVLQVSMISQGEVTDATLVPSAYEERLLWDVQRMTFEGGYARLPNGMQLAQAQPQALQDTASQFVELGHRFASGRETLRVGTQVRVWLARPQGTALWTYDVVAEETLQTPEFGQLQAFHLRPRPIANPAGVITAEIWFAPSLQYLPVRVRIALGGDNHVDLMVERIEQGASPTEPAPAPTQP